MRSRWSIFLNDSCQGSDNIASQAPIRKRKSQNWKPRLCWVSFFMGGGGEFFLQTYIFKQLQYFPLCVSTSLSLCAGLSLKTSTIVHSCLQTSCDFCGATNQVQDRPTRDKDWVSQHTMWSQNHHQKPATQGSLKRPYLLLVLLNLSSLF